MRVCIVSPNFPPYVSALRIAHFTGLLASNILRAGHSPTVLTSNPASRRDDWDFPVAQIPGNWGTGHLLSVARWLRSNCFDIVDVQYETAMYRMQATPLILPLVLPFRQFPLVLTTHSLQLPKRGGRLWRPLQLLTFDGVAFYSQKVVEAMSCRFPRAASRLTSQSIPATIFRTSSPNVRALIDRLKCRYLDDTPLIVYFGHINAGRGIEDVIEAFATIEQPFHLVLISQFDPATNDYHRSLLERVRTGGLQDRVSFSDQLDDDTVSRLLSSADGCVLPFPAGALLNNTILAAAMEHCIPTIATFSTNTEPEIRQSRAIIGYTPGDTDDLRGKLKLLISDHSLRATMRNEAELMRDMFSWKRYVTERLRFYEQVAGRFRKGSQQPRGSNIEAAG